MTDQIFPPQSLPGTPAEAVKAVTRPLFEAKGWMKLLAVVAFIYGGIMVLTIFGVIIAWLPIWIGVLLWQSSTRIEPAHIVGDVEAATESLGKLKTLFILYGVLVLVGLVFLAVSVLVVLTASVSVES